MLVYEYTVYLLFIFCNYYLATSDLYNPLCSLWNKNYLFKFDTSIVSKSNKCNSPNYNFDKTFNSSHPIPPTPIRSIFKLDNYY